MRQSQGPFGDEPGIVETESRRLTPSIGLAHDSEQPTDSSNEDFLFHLYRGSELLQDNRVHEAKEELERALHLQPRDSKGQDLLAVVYFRLGLYPRAIQIYEQLRRRNTNDTALLLNLALCYLKTGQPQNARRDLEQLLTQNPSHARAWGYLGLACERMGDLVQAERSFRQGGHAQMAKRIAARLDFEASPSSPTPGSQPTQEIRDVAGAAYHELDAGELSFALADPTRESNRDVEDAAAQSWRPHELGQVKTSDGVEDITPSYAPGGASQRKPDTKDAPQLDSPESQPMAPSVPQLGVPQSLNRRPTLIAPVGAPPAHEAIASEYAAVERIPSHAPPNFALDDAGVSMPTTTSPSIRRPVVAVPNPFVRARSHQTPQPLNALEVRTRTLPPPLNSPASVPPQAQAKVAAKTDSLPPSTPLGIGLPPQGQGQEAQGQEAKHPSVRPITARAPGNPDIATDIVLSQRESRDDSSSRQAVAAAAASSSEREPRFETRVSSHNASEITSALAALPVKFPKHGVVLHPSGVALVRTTTELGFAARLESLRAQQSGLRMLLLDRNVKGKPTGESFGGVSSPMVLASGEGQLVLAARPGRKLAAFSVNGEMCFAREDVLLGFGAGLAYENGRLSTGDGEHVPVVQLRGDGSVLLESIGEVLILPVHSDRSLSVRREVILAWFGRLVPRAIAPSDAPCGQRGLVSFAGEGRVLISSS